MTDKRMIITEEHAVIDGEYDISIDDLISRLQKLKEQGWQTVTPGINYGCYDETYGKLVAVRNREETDEEYNKRMNTYEQNKQREYQYFLKLKEQFEPDSKS